MPGYSDFEHVLVIEVDQGRDACYFWAHQFLFSGGSGGYLGLQTKGGPGLTWGRIAIFSIWDAVGARGSYTNRFTGEGEGWHTAIRYPWIAGRPYALRVGSPEPSWWVASIRDRLEGTETEIGGIHVPSTWGRLDGWSVMWTEWYGGPVARCEDLPHSSVVFHRPTADDGSVQPARQEDHLGVGASCRNSAVEKTETGARHQVGL